ncbi:hypothetical protein WJX74_004216 [Apatococcus lobatus]|uniref:WLM domain-containing protein n=1 Tax=Apatococcus lobatus TaxID=904363 RepID=A0AAW1R190_9CHLO
MTSASQSLRVTVNGKTQEIGPLRQESLVLQLQQLLEQATGLAPSTMKLFLSGTSKGILRLEDVGSKSLTEAGIKLGSKVMLTGSTAAELDSIVNAHDLPGLAPLDHDLLRSRERAAASNSATTALPSGPYTFGRFESWQQPCLSPPPSAALKLLHRLAADPGIVAVMRKHRWEVGLLSEMPPEGKVGVSAMCILGYNVNAGQEISLRLRTDDLKGFRRYDRIHETLCHELAHMVHSEHDANFKALNSLLLKESAALDWTQGAGHRAAAAAAAPSEAGQSFSAPHGRLMAATAASSGRTLAQLSSHDPITGASVAAGSQIPGMGHVDPTTAAAEAAMARLGGTQGLQPSLIHESQPPRPRESNAEAIAQHVLHPSGTSAEHHCNEPPHRSSHDGVTADCGTAMDEDVAMAMPTELHNACVISPEHLKDSAAAGGGIADGSHEQQISDHASAASHKAPAAQCADKDAFTNGCLTHEASSAQRADDDAWTSTSLPDAGAELGTIPMDAAEESMSASATVPHASAVGAAAAVSTANASIESASRSASLPQAHAHHVDSPAAKLHTAANGTAHQSTASGSSAAELEAGTSAFGTADGNEDPGAARYRRAAQAAQDLVREAGGADGARALATLATILQNVLDHPNEDKFRHIRLSNPAFMSRAGRFPASLQLLQLAGFSAVAQELRWQRNDPGLVWLSLAALRSTQAA